MTTPDARSPHVDGQAYDVRLPEGRWPCPHSWSHGTHGRCSACGEERSEPSVCRAVERYGDHAWDQDRHGRCLYCTETKAPPTLNDIFREVREAMRVPAELIGPANAPTTGEQARGMAPEAYERFRLMLEQIVYDAMAETYRQMLRNARDLILQESAQHRYKMRRHLVRLIARRARGERIGRPGVLVRGTADVEIPEGAVSIPEEAGTYNVVFHVLRDGSARIIPLRRREP